MNLYPLDTLLKLWGREEVTPEQAIGQLLQHISALQARLEQVEKQIRNLLPPAEKRPS